MNQFLFTSSPARNLPPIVSFRFGVPIVGSLFLMCSTINFANDYDAREANDSCSTFPSKQEGKSKFLTIQDPRFWKALRADFKFTCQSRGFFEEEREREREYNKKAATLRSTSVVRSDYDKETCRERELNEMPLTL